MINAKELRIGNWVRYEKENFKIHSVSPELPCLDTIEFGVGVVTYENIYPIELTEDIIIKCGFQKLSFNDGRHLFKLNEFYIEQRGLKFNRVEVNEAGNRIMYVGGKTTCDNIHQLQNLFFDLSGEELNIELNAPVSDTTKAK